MTRGRVGGGRILTVAMAIGLAASAASCTVASPGLIDPGPDHGNDLSVAVAPSVGCAADESSESGPTTVTVDVDGVGRVGFVTAPTDGAELARPLLLSLHPFLMQPSVWEDYSGLAAAATARGYIVVTPWGSDPGPRWSVPGGLVSDSDDMKFISLLLDRIESEYCIDRNEVYAAGFSAGAAMAQALSCWMPERIRAIAGSGGVNLTLLCPDSPPTDVLVMHGAEDQIVPPAGSSVGFAPPAGISVDMTVATDAARAGCDTDPIVEWLMPTVTSKTFTGCADGHRVQYVSLLGAGHTWAGSPNPVFEVFVGLTNTDRSANELVLDFFDATT